MSYEYDHFRLREAMIERMEELVDRNDEPGLSRLERAGLRRDIDDIESAILEHDEAWTDLEVRSLRHKAILHGLSGSALGYVDKALACLRADSIGAHRRTTQALSEELSRLERETGRKLSSAEFDAALERTGWVRR